MMSTQPISVLADGADSKPEIHSVPALEGRNEAAVVSVLIISHQCREMLRACLASLALERKSISLEVILVDNGSTDGTVAAVSEEYPWVQLICNRRNDGFARAANQAMRAAQGDFLLLLNPDTVVPPDTVRQCLRALQEEDELGMLGCKLVRPDGSLDHACKRGFPSISTALYYFFGLGRLFPNSPRFAQYTAGQLDPDKAGFVDAINGAFMLVRREAIADVGEMDERFWLYAEDLDWCYRFWERGWKILYWPEAEVIHIKGGCGGNPRSPKLNLAFHRSIWLYYSKYQSRRRPKLVNALVFLGVWSKFYASLVTSLARSLIPRGNGRPPYAAEPLKRPAERRAG